MARHKITGDVIHCAEPTDIPVYPVFGIFGNKKHRLGDNPYICEDDWGRVAFVSQEARRKFVKDYRRKLLRGKEDKHQ